MLSTSVRLDVEQMSWLASQRKWGFEIVCCKAHEICVFSTMETESL